MTRQIIPMNNGEYYIIADERLDTMNEEARIVSFGHGSLYCWRVVLRCLKKKAHVWLAMDGVPQGEKPEARLFSSLEDAHFYADLWLNNRLKDIRIWLALNNTDNTMDMYVPLLGAQADRPSILRSLDQLYNEDEA